MPNTVRLSSFVMLVCAAFLTACSHVNHLREAQDSFNQAAVADNLYRYSELQPEDLNGSNPATDTLSSAAGYAATVAAIEALKKDDKAKKRLQADELYGYALALQSLAYWRMEKWVPAVATGREAVDTGHLGDRDLALMQALPGLIKNNQGFAKLKADRTVLVCTQTDQPLSFVKWELKLNDTPMSLHCDPEGIYVRDQLAGALCDVDTARIGAPEGHPVRGYLALSQLATVANLRDMCDGAKIDGAPTGNALPGFYSACVEASVRTGNCVAGQYRNSKDVFVEAIVNDFCRGRPLEQKGFVFNLVKKSGIDSSQLAAACPEPKP